MARSVYITTPMPTLEEVAKDLGISKRRQEALLRIVHGDNKPRRPARKNHSKTTVDSAAKETRPAKSKK